MVQVCPDAIVPALAGTIAPDRALAAVLLRPSMRFGIMLSKLV